MIDRKSSARNVGALGALALVLAACAPNSPSDDTADSDTNLVDVSNAQPAGVETQSEAPTTSASASAWLVGSWISAPRGGDDGRTDCGDFNAPSLYKLNGDTATIVTYGNDGEYRSLFAYTTPSGEEHATFYKAKWALNGDTVTLSNMMTRDAFQFNGGSDTLTVADQSQNVQLVSRASSSKPDRFVRCIGPVDGIYGE